MLNDKSIQSCELRVNSTATDNSLVLCNAINYKTEWKKLMLQCNPKIAEEILENTFTKITSGKILSYVLVSNNKVIALTNFLFHTSMLHNLVCYVNDLIISPPVESINELVQLFDSIILQAKDKNCSKIYWNAAKNDENKHYNKIGKLTHWVIYERNLNKSNLFQDHQYGSETDIVKCTHIHKDGWKRIMSEYHQFYQRVPTDTILDTGFAKIESQKVESFVVIINNEIVATANFILHFHTYLGRVCYLSDLIVTSSRRGRGFAKALIIKVTDYAINNGCNKIYWTTAPDNPAKALYEQAANLTNLVKYEISI